LAGELGDRWLGHRKMAEREESPDTVVVGSQEPVTKKSEAFGLWGKPFARFWRAQGKGQRAW
jgi:hypothetical protein